MSYYYQPEPSVGHKRKRSLASDRELDLEEADHHQTHHTHEHDLAERTLHDQPWTFLACPDALCSGGKYAHTDAIIVSTKGACKCNGRPWADGAVGVFFHPRADGWNQSVRLPAEMVHTTHRAELYAGILALRVAADIRARNPTGRKRMQHPAGPLRRLRRVIVQTDSAYLAQDMGEWIYNWRQFGATSQMRASLGNADLFRELEDLVIQLFARGVQVEFVVVPPARNRGADRLAAAALEGLVAAEAVGQFASYYSDQDSDDSPMML